MKKVLAAVAIIGLVFVFSFAFIVRRERGEATSNNASGNAYSREEIREMKKTVTFEKNGRTITVEGPKDDTADVTMHEMPPEYDPGDREWVGDPAAWEQLKHIVTDALQAERDAKLYTNLDRREEFKEKLGQFFSAGSGELQKRRRTVDMAIQSASGGYGRTKSVITKLDFKGISVQDNKATVVADVWSYTSYKDFGTNKDDGGGETGEQHTLNLALENNRWLITKDLWVFIPGYEP